MNNLLTLKYWFTLRPETLNPLASKIFIAALLALIVLSVLFLWLKTRKGLYRHLFRKLYNFSLSNALIGLLLLFFNYENAIFFSARFWLLLWLIIMIIWLLSILKDLKKIPSLKQKNSAEEIYKKYLP